MRHLARIEARNVRGKSRRAQQRAYPERPAASGPAYRYSLVGQRSPGCSLHAIADEDLRNVGLDRLRGCDVGLAARFVAALELRHAAAIERVGILRALGDGRAIIRNRTVERPALQLHETAGVENVGGAWVQPERLVAVGKRSGQVASR